MIAALLDHLWQSTLFMLAAGLLTLLVRKNGAHVRYWLWLTASVKFLIPFSLLAAVGSQFATPFSLTFTTPPAIDAVQSIARPFSAAVGEPAVSVAPELAVSAANGIGVPAILFGLWSLGLAAILLFRFVRWIRIDVALWTAKPLAMTGAIPVKSSQYFLEPGLVGITRPVLLLPDGINERLSPGELNAVFAHELCHLRRRDNLTATIHMVVEALFWFYPPVWWIGARLIEERERACDENVLASGNDPLVYAESILKVCQFYVRSPLASVSGVSGADLKKRLEAIMIGRATVRMNIAKKLVLSAAGAIALFAPLAAGSLTPPVVSVGVQKVVSGSPEEIAARRSEQEQPRAAIPFDPADFDKYTGYYMLDQGRAMHVSRRDEHLFARLAGGPSIEVHPESKTKFFAKELAAQISFAADARGRTMELVLHQSGFERHATRINEAAAPYIDTEASLRRYIASLQNGQPNYDEMMPDLAAAVRKQLPAIEAAMARWGALKSITYEGMNPLGADIYNATFEHGQVRWTIAPLTRDGKVAYRGFSEIGTPPGIQVNGP